MISVHRVCSGFLHRLGIFFREKVDFIETTALRQRRNEGREVTVTSGLHRQKDKERQRKTEEKGEKRPVVAPGAGVRWRGSSTGAPGVMSLFM